MVGDGVGDMQAAKAAGIVAVGLASTPERRKELIAAGADIIINGDYSDLDSILRALNLEPTNTARKRTARRKAKAGR